MVTTEQNQPFNNENQSPQRKRKYLNTKPRKRKCIDSEPKPDDIFHPRKLRPPYENIVALSKNDGLGLALVNKTNYQKASAFEVLQKSAQESPLKVQTRTPRKRFFTRLPFEVYLGNKKTGEEVQQLRFLMLEELALKTNESTSFYDYSSILSYSEKEEILANIGYRKKPHIKLKTITLDQERILQYRGQRSRFPSQKIVMGDSAQDYVTVVAPGLARIAKWHWCHLYAFSLGGTKTDGPQVKRNLVAGTSNCNYLMLAFEREIKQYILENPNLNLRITAHVEFKKLFLETKYTKIADKIFYRIKNAQGKYITIVFFGTNTKGYNKILNQYAQNMADYVLSTFKEN